MDSSEQPSSFTEFMINVMAGKEGVTEAVVVYRKEDGVIGYRIFNQDTTNTIGMLRFATLSVEHDLVESWKD